MNVNTNRKRKETVTSSDNKYQGCPDSCPNVLTTEPFEEKPSVFEKAYDGLSKVGSFFKTMTTKVVDYVYAETPRASSRSRNRIQSLE